MNKADEIRKIIIAPLEDGMTTTELARKINCLPRTVGYWKTGERMPSLNQAHKALTNLGISVTIGGEKE